MQVDFKQFCINSYKSTFEEEYSNCNLKKDDDKRKFAQKKAIKLASIKAMQQYPNVDPREIWHTVYVAHVNNYSGIYNSEVIKKVISADNSWKKSSGHAFEELIRDIGNINLLGSGIKILLQKELSIELANNNILNENRDINWLKDQISTSIFDLYLAIVKENGILIYGCVQSKTSIRDRVTRDREPSINAMKAFFVSFAVVLDGQFLRLPKFQNMVNGKSSEYAVNGWHSMYVFSNELENNDRIKTMDIDMMEFVEDCISGAEFWSQQRQWLNPDWRP